MTLTGGLGLGEAAGLASGRPRQQIREAGKDETRMGRLRRVIYGWW